MWMLMEVADLLSSGGFGAKMSILTWTRSHQRGAGEVFQAGSLDTMVKGFDGVRVALIRAAWMAMKSCLFCGLVY